MYIPTVTHHTQSSASRQSLTTLEWHPLVVVVVVEVVKIVFNAEAH